MAEREKNMSTKSPETSHHTEPSSPSAAAGILGEVGKKIAEVPSAVSTEVGGLFSGFIGAPFREGGGGGGGGSKKHH